jgi:hypothetical protein
MRPLHVGNLLARLRLRAGQSAGIPSAGGLTSGWAKARSQPAEFVIDAYRRLWHIEKAFRMFKHDLQARPISCRRRHEIGYADIWIMPTIGLSVLVSGVGQLMASA